MAHASSSAWLQPGRLQKRDDVSIEFRVAIEDDITIRASFGKGLAQLLDDPIRRWLPRDIEVQDLTTGGSITKKQYSNLKLTVGTVKKSKATIASR